MAHRRIARGGASLLLVAALAGAAPALAQPSAADRETARALLLDGRAKLDAGDARAALEAFRAAHAIMGVPTTGLDVARALSALGRLIEARATALDVTRQPERPDEPAAFAEARVAAAKLADELGPRIPSLVIRIAGLPNGAPVSVRVDGEEVPAAAVTLPRKANPGSHRVEAAAAGFTTAIRTVTLKEGDELRVDLSLVPVAVGAPTPSVPALEAEVSTRRVPVWAWVAGTAGLAALGVGAAFAVDYANVRASVGADCPGNTCSPKVRDQVSTLLGRWNRDLGLMVGTGVGGLAGVVVGALGVSGVVGKNERTSRGAMLAPWVAPGTTGVVIGGRF